MAKTSYRRIATQYDIGYKSVERHVEHMAQGIKDSQEAREEAQSINVVKQLKEINDVTNAILRDALAQRKNGMALFAIDRVIKQLELQAKLLGDLDQPQVNVWVMPEWRAIREVIIHALAPYPDARVAVAGALASLEEDRARLN